MDRDESKNNEQDDTRDEDNAEPEADGERDSNGDDSKEESESPDEPQTAEPVEAPVEPEPESLDERHERDEPVVELEPAKMEQKAAEVLVEGRSTKRLWIALGVAVAIILCVGLVIWQALSLINEEESAWRQAETEHSETGWQGYLRWATGIREGGGLRAIYARRFTSMDARAQAATEHAIESRAEAAAVDEDWPVLCAILQEHAESQGAIRAREGLHHRIERGITAYNNLSKRRDTPAEAVSAVVASLQAARDEPCGEGALIRVAHSVNRDEAFSQHVREGQTVADVLESVDLEERRRSIAEAVAAELRAATAGALSVRYVATDDDATGLLDIRITETFRSRDRFLTPSGSQLPGVELAVRVEVSAPSLDESEPTDDSDTSPATEPGHASTATLPQTFAMEFFREGSALSPESVERTYTQAVNQLYPHVGEHMRRVLGLSRFVRTTGTGSVCSRVPPIQANQVVQGSTHDGAATFYGSCENYEEYDDYGDGYDNEVRESEKIYRLVVPTRSDVAVGVDSDFLPIVYIRRECASIVSEVACNEVDGQLETTLDAGVYYVFIDTAQDETPGPFSAIVAVRDAEQVSTACSGAQTLVPGTSVSGTTAGGRDDLSGTCGGVGSPERVYALEVSERSRLRCAQEGSFDSTLYMRTQCTDRETEVACRPSNARFQTTLTTMVDQGLHALAVDGLYHDRRGSYELRCELAPAQGAEGAEADSCTTPGTINGPRPLDVDTFLARDDLRGSCGGTGGPDQVFRLNVTSHTRLRATWPTTGFRGILHLQRECGGEEVTCARVGTPLVADITPGTYYLVVDGSSPTNFGAARITVTLDDLERLCATGVPIQPGESVRGEIANRPSRFSGTCNGSRDGAEVIHLLTLDQRSHVTVRARTSFDVALYMRRSCTGQEIACTLRNPSTRETVIERDLAPGHYYIFLEAQHQRGAYELNVEATPSQ